MISQKPHSDLEQDIRRTHLLLSRLKYVVYVGLLFVLITIGLYFYQFSGGLSQNQGEWGEFGEYIGGLLDPAFSFLGLIALLATLALQVQTLIISEKGLKNSEEALAKQNDSLLKQNFEASFFQLLRLHNDIVNSMDLINRQNGQVTKGRDCIKVFLTRLEDTLRHEGADKNYDSFLTFYEIFFMNHQDEIGHYFRLLYNIIKLIKNTDGIDKRFYSNLVRAQLSAPELKLLFYNCLSTWGKEKFKPLVEEFALLKTMPNTVLPDDALLHQYSLTAFGGSYPKSFL